VKRVVVPRRSKANKDIAIATISLVPQGQIPFENIADVMQDFLVNEARVGFRDIQPCPFGSAYVQFTHVRDRDRLIRESPIPFNDVHVSFAKHNEGANWRKTYFNRECWLLLVGPPLDHWFTEDINAVFSDIGKVLLWEKDLGNKGRILAKVRVTKLAEIPKSIRFSEGDAAESESWTFSVEVLQESLLGGGPADEDPLPENGEDPHPLPNLNHVNPQPPLPNVADQGNDLDDVGGWDHWAMGNNVGNNVDNLAQPMELDADNNIALNNLLEAAEAEAEELQLNQLSPVQDLNSGITVTSSEGANSVNNSFAQAAVGFPQLEVQQPAEHFGLGVGLHNLMNAYHGEDGGDSDSDNSLGNMFLLDDVNMVDPNEAHLQIGMARTHFFPIEKEITKSFSREGMEI
jgi:hypothetical protein